MTNSGAIFSQYDKFFAASLAGRYITLEHLKDQLNLMGNEFEYSVIGRSENGLEIPMIRIGNGGKRVLAWSQMHGNESTTTKAVMDFISFCDQKEVFQDEKNTFLNTYSFYVIPILNPDGAVLYTRENKNGIDLNRDAIEKSQSESRALAETFNQIQPELCLNLHDQRTMYGASPNLPATVSFLAPSADAQRSITNSRKVAMSHIERITKRLGMIIPGQVGRYDDGFNANCVGDTFQMKNVPTILFEAGHFPNDYQREETRKLIFLAFLELFRIDPIIASESASIDYADIPENNKKFRDVILRNVMCPSSGELIGIGLQYDELLVNDSIKFQAVISEIGDLDLCQGHLEIDVQSVFILVDSQELFEIGQHVSTVCRKNDHSVVYFSMK